MIVIELLLALGIISGFGAWGISEWRKERRAELLRQAPVEAEKARIAKLKKRAYIPPLQRPNEPATYIRTHGLAIFWHEVGCPRELGTQVEVNMKSGKTAIYELRNIERAIGVDWSWYDLEFVRYSDSASSAADSPARESNA